MKMTKLNLQMFARAKNAKRKHEIQAFNGYDETTGEAVEPTANWLRLAKWIPTITDDSAYNTEEYGDYSGDGTPSTEVISISQTWAFAGTYDSTDPAQEMLAEMKRTGAIGDESLVWHRITYTNGKVYQGLATAHSIIAGSGDATAHEEFAVTLSFKNTPEDVTPETTP